LQGNVVPEALLLLQMLMLDASEDLSRRWSEGEQFKPGWVRNELKAKSFATVRDVIVQTGQETHELNRIVYAWLGSITHANRESINLTAKRTGDESYEIFVGGSLVGMETLMNATFATVCHGLHITGAICVGVFDAARLKKTGTQWSALEKRINDAVRKPNSPGPLT
jgi:hypothetical protein